MAKPKPMTMPMKPKPKPKPKKQVLKIGRNRCRMVSVALPITYRGLLSVAALTYKCLIEIQKLNERTK